MTYRNKLIEVALLLDAINAASAREKSIRHSWWIPCFGQHPEEV